MNENKMVTSLLEKYYPIFETSQKLAQISSDSLNIASLNELRNAMSHIYRGIQAEKEQKEYGEELSRAEQHLKRAIADSLEITMISQISKLSEGIKERRLDAEMRSEAIKRVNELYALLENTINDEKDVDYYRDITKKLVDHVQDTNYLIAASEFQIKNKNVFSALRYFLMFLIGAAASGVASYVFELFNK